MTAKPDVLVTAIKDWGVDFRPYPFSDKPWHTFTTPGGWDPAGVLHHHTAGGPALLEFGGMNPSKAAMLRLLRIGRDLDGNGTMDGPLCHFAPAVMERGKRVVFGIGFGNVNHAGFGGANVAAAIRKGTYAGARPTADQIDGNSMLYGLEYLHPGTGAAWPDELLDAGHRTAAAISEAEGWSPGSWAGSQAEHREWTSRKVDRSWTGQGDGMRSRMAALAAQSKEPRDGWERTDGVQKAITALRGEESAFRRAGKPGRATVCGEARDLLAVKFPRSR